MMSFQKIDPPESGRARDRFPTTGWEEPPRSTPPGFSSDREIAAFAFSLFVLGIPSIGVTCLLIGWLIFFG